MMDSMETDNDKENTKGLLDVILTQEQADFLEFVEQKKYEDINSPEKIAARAKESDEKDFCSNRVKIFENIHARAKRNVSSGL